MKEDFPNSLLSENPSLPDEQVILSRLQTMLLSESQVTREDHSSAVSGSVDETLEPQTDRIDETDETTDEPEDMEVNHSSS